MQHPTFNIQQRTSNFERTKHLEFVGRWMFDVRCWMFLAPILVITGCATFHPQPVAPEKTAAAFDARLLNDVNLRAYLETNRVTGDWPRDSWDLNALTLVAFYYQPALAEARAQWAAVEAA